MARKVNNTLTTEDIYNLIDRKIGEVNQSINRLNESFSTLESGRLSSVEKQVANMQGRMMMIPTIISISISIFFFLMNYVLNSTK